VRSSEREATRSREGLDWGRESRAKVCMVGRRAGAWPVIEAADLRSVWRLFWNHIVTDFISLVRVSRERGRREEGDSHSASTGEGVSVVAGGM